MRQFLVERWLVEVEVATDSALHSVTKKNNYKHDEPIVSQFNGSPNYVNSNTFIV